MLSMYYLETRPAQQPGLVCQVASTPQLIADARNEGEWPVVGKGKKQSEAKVVTCESPVAERLRFHIFQDFKVRA